MLGSARKFVALCAATIVSLALPAVAAAAKPTSPGGGNGKKSQTSWAGGYTYQACWEYNLAAVPDPEALAGWQPTAPDPNAEDPLSGAVPPVLPGYSEIPDNEECAGTASASRDSGALSVNTSWTSVSTEPLWEGAASSGAGLYRSVSVREPINSLTATATFVTTAGAFQVERSDAGYGDVSGHLFVRRPDCSSPCQSEYENIALASNNVQGYTEVAPGEHRVTVTLTAPEGEKLPVGTYQVTQLLSTWVGGLRLPDQSSSARGAVVAKAVTITTG